MVNPIVPISAVMLIASTVRTAFGFGEALIAVPLLALIIPIQTAAPVAVLASIVIAGFVLLRDWRHIHFHSAAWLIFSTLIGVPFGLFLLKTGHEPLVKGVLGTTILCFSSFCLLGREPFTLRNDRFAWFFGFFAGVFGGAYGLNGPPLVVYGSMRGWNPEKFRATLQGYFLPASIAGMVGYRAAGLWTPTVDQLFLWCLPSIALGIAAGRIIIRRLDRAQFLRYVHVGLCFVGALLLFQAATVR